MNHDRIYEYRFKDVDLRKKNIVWKEIAELVHERTNRPAVVLDPAVGMCEFINNVPADERWAIDLNGKFLEEHAQDGITKVVGDNREVELPSDYFDLVFISNFLEHLDSQEEVSVFLERIFGVVKPGGFLVVMGPNFKYAYREYFDFADHTVCLSELGAAEHIVGAGFTIKTIWPRFLPLSFRGGLPVNRFLVRSYLKMPFAWRFFGKQFLIVAQK